MKKDSAPKLTGILAAFLLVAFSASIACAAPGPVAPPPTSDPLNTWKTTGSCGSATTTCDFTGKTIPKLDATVLASSTKTLENAIFKNCIFEEGVDLTGYNLKNAKFYNATLKGAKLNNAKVTQANFQMTKFYKDSKGNKTDLTGISSDTDQPVDFLDADLIDAVKPDNWPASATLRRAKHASNITCADDDTKGYCKNSSVCKDYPNKFRVKKDNTCSAD